jgi:nucleoside-diphosphate-sugar epimerase
MQVKKSNISILGCGWLGLPLATYLVQNDFVVNGSVRSSEKKAFLKSKNIIPFLVDIDKEETIALDFFIADVLVIAIPSKNILGFQKLISQIEKSSIKKVILISSTSVYPTSENEIKETNRTLDTPLALIEKLFLKHSGFKTTILRFGGLFGDNRNPGNFFKNGRIIKNPEGVVNMIHQEDCIDIMHQIIKKGIETEVFNACADTHPTRRSFYTNVKLKLGLETPVFEENQPVEMKRICSEKLKSKLNFNFKYSDLLNI